MTIVKYDPPIEEHPSYTPETPDFEEGQVVDVLSYSGVRVVYDDDDNRVGTAKYLSERAREKNDPPYTGTHYVVEDDGFRVKVKFTPKADPRWIPRDMIVGVNLRKTAEWERRERDRKRWRARVEERKETDLDTLMEEVVIPHARRKASEVWPGGTVDVDEISWFWNKHLTNCAGKAYWGTAVPDKRYDISSPAIALAPAYYYQHGIDELLETVRHELIHVWQYRHENGFTRGGHGQDFKQWMDDMDTHRHCKHWSK